MYKTKSWVMKGRKRSSFASFFLSEKEKKKSGLNTVSTRFWVLGEPGGISEQFLMYPQDLFFYTKLE